MAILPLVTFPDPLLKEVSQHVDNVDEDIQNLMDSMIETMYRSRGVGLAAVQIGHLKRILVMDVNYKIADCCADNFCPDTHVSGKEPIFMVNPKIVGSSKAKAVYNEGCLSFPTITASITRPKEVEVAYLDYNGEEKLLKADGLLATCVQHEIDHINGITFVDYLSKIKRDMLLKKMKRNIRLC